MLYSWTASCINHSLSGGSSNARCVVTNCCKIAMLHLLGAENASTACRCPNSNFGRMKLFGLSQIEILRTPKSPVLFINESIKMEMCFIGEPKVNRTRCSQHQSRHCQSHWASHKQYQAAVSQLMQVWPGNSEFFRVTYVGHFAELYAFYNSANQSLFFRRISWVAVDQLQKLCRHFPE